MACHSVLRIGPLTSPDSNASLLRSAISSHFKPNSSAQKSDEDELTISNRYFNASVLLKSLNESIPQPDNSHIQEDGIILVFNSSQDANEQSFNSLETIHEAAEQSSKAGDLLRLCIGASHGPSSLSDGSKASEAEYSRRVLWCLDRGYEYVEVDLTPEAMASGHEERDKEGFARVVEAISSCMWSSHVMKPRGSAVVVDATNAKSTQTDVEKKTNNEPVVDSNSATVTNDDANREALAMASLMNGIEESKPQDIDPNCQIQQQEMAFHELEQVMSEAKRIREASQSNSITDEERRQRAGDTAVRLMGLLDKLGFDEDDLGEDDSDVDDPAMVN